MGKRTVLGECERLGMSKTRPGPVGGSTTYSPAGLRIVANSRGCGTGHLWLSRMTGDGGPNVPCTENDLGDIAAYFGSKSAVLGAAMIQGRRAAESEVQGPL
jgi:hypothetical protein